jgi:ATP-dependent helicase IRC3
MPLPLRFYYAGISWGIIAMIDTKPLIACDVEMQTSPRLIPAPAIVAPAPGFALRPYQSKQIHDVLQAFGNGYSRVLFVQSTGCGKTLTFGKMIESIRQSDPAPALIIAHREELLYQAVKAMRFLDPTCRVGVEISDVYCPRSVDVICASVASIGRKGSKRLAWLERMRPSVIVIDECHHSTAPTYVEVVRRFGGFDGVPVIGCTATPKRLDKQMLHGNDSAVFELMTEPYLLRDAIRDGWLTPIRGWVIKTEIDLDAVGSSGGDFKTHELSLAVNARSRTSEAIRHWREKAGHRKTVVFCVDVEHAMSVRDAFMADGISALCVHGGMHVDDRRRSLAAHKAGDVQVLTNVNVLTEGYDDPSVDCILMLRPTKSWSLFVQCVGRGTRLYPGKRDLIVIDVVDVSKKHDLASIPAILDLPPTLDLEGNLLHEAADVVDEIAKANGDLAAALIMARKKGGKKQEELDYGDLKTVLREVDFLAAAQTPKAIAQFAKLAWRQIGLSAYRVDCGGRTAGADTVRSATLFLTGGRWTLSLTQGTRSAGTDSLFDAGLDFEQTVKAAEYQIVQAWPDARVLASANSGWRRKKASPKQLSVLRKWKVPETLLGTMTADDASRMIDAKISAIRGGTI